MYSRTHSRADRPYAPEPRSSNVARERIGAKTMRQMTRNVEYDERWAEIELQVAPLFDYWPQLMQSPESAHEESARLPRL